MKLNIQAVFVLAAVLALAAGAVWANNLTLTNVTLKPRDDRTAFVRFDLRWENSWRYTNINHDAAWVFFKIKAEGRTAWEQVTLETNGHEVGIGTPIKIIVPEDRVGCFIRREEEGAGPVSVTNVLLAWNFASNSLVKTDRVCIQAMAVEMVYVAEGDFWVGDGTSLNIRGQFEDATNGTPFQVTNEAYEIILGGGGVGSLGNNNASNMASTHVDDFHDSKSTNLPASFPKGYAAFYCMKYEMTQGQYRDFLNTLTRGQQNNRTASQVAGYFALSAKATIQDRNGIRCPLSVPLAPSPIVFGCDGNADGVFNQTNDAMDRACNCVCWLDITAYFDWMGLRPMTELEFEKACRGPLLPVANEYAWGDATISAVTALLNDGSGMENATNGNCAYSASVNGPYRVGIFATTNSTRSAAGASYWGIMELSGNVYEPVVAVGQSQGRAYTGLHGDGRLDELGYANVTLWPTTAGAGVRGGQYDWASEYVRVSDRDRVLPPRTTRYESDGARGVRTAPAGVGR